MSDAISTSQIDRLGARLKRGEHTEGDLRALDEYRQTFASSYGFVVSAIRRRLNLEPTGRPAKSTTSIVEKLQRETIRLSQVQDIAGCRVLAKDVLSQDRVVAKIQRLFSETEVIDRRQQPSHGYRAVHVIVRVERKPIEVQVRSGLQHQWAEVSEKLSDAHPGVKYGRGPEKAQTLLLYLAGWLAGIERNERRYARLRHRGFQENRMRRIRARLAENRRQAMWMLRVLIELSDKMEFE